MPQLINMGEYEHGSEVIDSAVPSGNALIKGPSQTGFFVRSEKPYTVWFKNASGAWALHQSFTEATLQKNMTFRWSDNTQVYFQSSDADHKIYVFPRTGALIIDGDVMDADTTPNTLVLGSGASSQIVATQQGPLDSLSVTGQLSVASADVAGPLSVTSADLADVPFRISTPRGDDFLVCDASSSLDGRERVMIRTTNDFPASETPHNGLRRGLFHVERDEDNDQYTSGISLWTHSRNEWNEASNLQLVSWANSEIVSSTLHLVTQRGGFPGGFVPNNQHLGQIYFGGYSNNQHRTQASVRAKANQAWSYSSYNGTDLELWSTKKGSNLQKKTMTVSETGVIMRAPTSPTDDANMDDSTVSISVDEAQNKLVFKVKYSDGTIKTGNVDLS
jgi:hypothetical protein